MHSVVSARLAAAAPTSAQLGMRSVKMLARCARILKLWKISAMLRVRNAMVVPSGEFVSVQTPYSMWWPMKNAASVRIAHMTP